MNWRKQSCGVLLALLSGAGIATCAAALVGTWVVGHRINSAVSELFGGVGTG
jgi:hypothetical protein